VDEFRDGTKCQDHWSITRDMQQRLAVVEVEIVALKSLQETVHRIELSVEKVTSRVTFIGAIVAPLCVALGASLTKFIGG